MTITQRKMHTMESNNNCKLCSLSKEEHISDVSFGGVYLGCKLENNFFKNYVFNLKKVIAKWI